MATNYSNNTKHHLGYFASWKQKEHASEWMLFEQNMGSYLSIDETAISSGELYTIVTNKATRGLKGSLS